MNLPEGFKVLDESLNLVILRITIPEVVDMSVSQTRPLLDALEQLITRGYSPIGIMSAAPIVVCRKPSS